MNKPTSPYLDYLKQYQNFDDYILFLYELGFSVAEVAELVDMSRQHVYNSLYRLQKSSTAYMASLTHLKSVGVSNEPSD